MADLAVLGLEIRSDGAVKAASDLDKLSASAGKAEKAVAATGASAEQASQRMGSGSKAVERLLQAIERVERAVRDQNTAIAKMGASLAAAEAQMMGTTKAAQSVATTISAAGAASAKASAQVETLGAAGTSAAAGIAAATTSVGRIGGSLQAANQNVKLTAQQVQGLGYQLNDIGTMLAMGASPFQIIASQAGQVIQVLQEGGGIKSSLTAIGTAAVDAGKMAVGALGPIGIGFAAVTAAAGAFALAVRKKVPDATETLKAHEQILAQVAERYKGVGEVLDSIAKRANIGLNIDLGANGRNLAEVLRSQVKQVEREFVGGGGFLGTSLFGTDDTSVLPAIAKLKPISDMLDGLRASFREANPDVLALSQQIVAFNQSLDNAYKTAGDDKEMRKAIEAARDFLRPVLATATALDQNAAAATGAAAAVARYRTAMAELDALIPDLRTNAEKINDAFAGALADAKSPQEQALAALRQQKALAADTAGAVELLNAARAEGASIGLGEEARAVAAIEQEYAKLQAQYQGNTDALIKLAEWRDQSINNVGSQAAFDREQEANKEREAAAKRATDEAQRYAEATRSRIAGIDQTVASQRLELDLMGQSEGASAALRFEFQALTAAKQAAAAAGGVVSEAELAKIREASAEVGRLTEQLAAKNAARSAVDQFFPFEAANHEAERLGAYIADVGNGLSDLDRQALQMQIDRGFVDAASAAENLRTRGVKAGEDIGRSFIENVGDVFADIFSSATRDGESFFSSILRGFAGLGSQLAAAGAKNLFGKLFGLPQDGQTQSAAGIGSFGTVERSFATTGTTMERKVLPALSGFSSELTAAAKAIRTIESGSAAGNYSAMGPVTRNGDRAYGAYQVMGNNIADWSRSAIGREVSKMEFLRSVRLQDKIFQHRFGGYMQKYGAEGASRAWFAGEGGMKNWNARDAVGTSVAGYNSRFGQLYTQNGGGSGFRTTSSIDERRYQKATAAGVKDGLTDYGRQASYGDYTAAGVDPWNMGGQNLRGGPAGFGQTALGALGAGLGIFGQGYQSGSPLQGGFSGALGGYQAAGALGFTSVGAGIAGGVLGAGLGILGGILGARKQREQEHRQKAAAWEQMRPAYEEFDRSLSGEKQGDLRKYVTEGWGQLSSFMSTGGAAWKYGSGNSTAQFDSTGRKLFEGFLKMLGDFRDGFDSMITDMSSGQGLQGAFAKGRNATKDLADQIKKTRDDVDIAFGNIASIDFLNTPGAQAQAEETAKSRADAIARYNDAAAKYALSLLYSAEKFSDVQQTIDGLRGTAAGLVPIFADLGWNADEAAKAINDRLSAAIANIARELEQTLADRVDDLNGRGYFATVRDFLDEYAGLQRDFAAAGADGSRLPEFFKLQAQEIVNGAELTGDAFAELIRLFPQLNGVVSEFVEKAAEAAKRTADELDKLRLSYGDRAFEAGLDTSTEAGALSRFDRYANRERETEAKAGGEAMADLERALAAERLAIVKDFREREIEEAKRVAEEAKRIRDEAVDYLAGFAKDIGSYLDGLRAGPSSPLNARDRLSEAETQFAKQYALAKSGDRDALSEITSYSDRLLEASRGYDASSPAYQAVFDRVTKALEDLPKLVRPEDLIKKAIDDAGKLTVEALEVMRIALGSAIQSGPKATADALSSYFTLLDSSLDGLLSFDELRAGLNGIATDAQIRQMMTVLDANGDGQISKLELLNATATAQGASLTDMQRLIRLTWEQAVWEQGILDTHRRQFDTMISFLSIGNGLMERIRANLAAANGKTGAPQYMQGGYTGNLPTTAAAGVVHGQEFVAHAEATRRWRPMLEQMNAGTFRMPTIAMPSMPSFVNDNRELVTEMRALRQEVSRLREENNAVTERAGERVREGVDDLKDAADQGNRETRRARRAG